MLKKSHAEFAAPIAAAESLNEARSIFVEIFADGFNDKAVSLANLAFAMGVMWTFSRVKRNPKRLVPLLAEQVAGELLEGMTEADIIGPH